MNNVTPLNKNSANNLVGDFQKQNIKFDIDKLRNACNEVLKIKGAPESLMSAIKIMPESIEIYKGLDVIENAIKEEIYNYSSAK